MLARIVRYFQEARAELARVTWPTREQVIEGTQAVLIFTVAWPWSSWGFTTWSSAS
jgi:preprotein translocase subunit SecE